MEDSILKTTKAILGLGADYTPFDLSLILHINTALNDLSDVGVGLDTGFMIEDDAATWTDFVGSDTRLNTIKSYVAQKVKSLFDPPQTGPGMTALEDQLKQMLWRINANADPGTVDEPDTILISGGLPNDLL